MARAFPLALRCGARRWGPSATNGRRSRRAAVAASLRRGHWSQQEHHSPLTCPAPLRSHMDPRPERVTLDKAAPAKSARDDAPAGTPRLLAACSWPCARAPPSHWPWKTQRDHAELWCQLRRRVCAGLICCALTPTSLGNPLQKLLAPFAPHPLPAPPPAAANDYTPLSSACCLKPVARGAAGGRGMSQIGG